MVSTTATDADKEAVVKDALKKGRALAAELEKRVKAYKGGKNLFIIHLK